MANNITAELTTWRADGQETDFLDGDPTLENLGEFLECVQWDGKPHQYQLVYDGHSPWPDVYNYQVWRMGGRKIALKGVAYEAVSVTGNIKDASVACQVGDGIQITIACSEVIVTDERNRAPGNYHDAVVDGVLYRGIIDRVIYVESEGDLDDLTGELPGTVAMTYDEASKWRWDGADWTAIGGDTEG